MRVHDAVGKSAGNCPYHEIALFIAQQLHEENSMAPQTIIARNVI
jgi:hypothetical protein